MQNSEVSIFVAGKNRRSTADVSTTPSPSSGCAQHDKSLYWPITGDSEVTEGKPRIFPRARQGDSPRGKCGWVRTSLRDYGSCCSAIPGFRCAPPWAIFPRSLRELCVPDPAIDRRHLQPALCGCRQCGEHERDHDIAVGDCGGDSRTGNFQGRGFDSASVRSI
jgi:hypothetical protein